MIWKNINLKEELDKTRHEEDATLKAFKKLLREDDQMDESILQELMQGCSESDKIDLSKLDPDRIYTTLQIKKLCGDYRLRFLPSRYYLGKIPAEALSEIKRIQRRQEYDLKDFRILAPAPMFRLTDRNKDPLLFLNLGNDRFYFIHKWGTDLHPLRKLMVFPFRSFKTLLCSVALITFLIAMIIPDSLIMGPYDQFSLHLRVIFFFYLFIAFGGLTILYGFSRVKNFNGSLWNSNYID